MRQSLFGILMSLLLVVHSQADTYLVKPDGSGHFATIQLALSSLTGEHVVELANGRFTGEGNRDIFFQGEPITLQSQSGDPDSCIIDCAGGVGNNHFGISFNRAESPQTRLEGITIANGHMSGTYYQGGHGGAIRCKSGAAPTIENCVFRDNWVGEYGGAVLCEGEGVAPTFTDCAFIGNATDRNGGAIYCRHSATIALSNCVFEDNQVLHHGGAVWFEESSSSITGSLFRNNRATDTGGAIQCLYGSPHIIGCVFLGNGSAKGGAIRCNSGAAPTIENTIIAFGIGGGAVSCQSRDAMPMLFCCDLFGNAGGDWLDCVHEQCDVNGNLCLDPAFCNPGAGNFTLRYDSPCAAENNPECGTIGVCPMGTSELYTVASDGSGDFATIQEALDHATECDVIELADGIYLGAGNHDLDFLGKAITLRSQSGHPDSCVIDCQGTAQDPHRAFDFQGHEGFWSSVENLTILAGWADRGGAIRCASKSSPRLGGLLMLDNYAEICGGAVACSDSSDPVLQGCTIYDNRAPAGAAVCAETFSDPKLKRTIVAENVGGEAVSCGAGATTHPSCCDIWGNEGGDWTGFIASLDSLEGNFSADPEFCDPSIGDFRLWNDSPCAQWDYPCGTYPPNSCGLIGVFPVGCWDFLEARQQRSIGLQLRILDPFCVPADIAYQVPPELHHVRVRLCVYNITGRLIRTLVDGVRPAGRHEVQWDGLDQSGKRVSGGLYFCRLRVAAETVEQRIILTTR